MIRRLPGLVDSHIHGAVGKSVMDGVDAIKEIGEYLALSGIYGWFPTTRTVSWDAILETINNVVIASKKQSSAEAKILGIHVEGPFLNPDFHGSQPVEYIIKPTLQKAEKLLQVAKGLPLIVTIAPEAPNAFEVIDYLVKNGATVSLGHTGATYEQMQRAIGIGANRITHLYNSMKFFHHREPGPIGTALYSDAYVELIIDGVHVHPATVGMTIKAKSLSRVIFVSNGTEGMGMEDGVYEIDGRLLKVEKGAAYDDGTLIGSATNLKDGIINLSRWLNMPLEELWLTASRSPLENMGLDVDLPLCTVSDEY
ncbi:N-acetylglucosamine-6-phosphate deacetylase [Coprothermobacter platensis]|uniref:N-acetylglucosamine-6-phosphate deacetylase n=1 Tax=Coprothermobacter platensis TaxID=108819 RepID=UPI00036A38B0|nr:N-acetylglucosamine-6-phosphate deacetylase [Coprothermobacter platensis]